jgi:hypothetical protein
MLDGGAQSASTGLQWYWPGCRKVAPSHCGNQPPEIFASWLVSEFAFRSGGVRLRLAAR